MTIPDVNVYLKTIYADWELAEAATIKSYLIVRSEDGREVTRKLRHYRMEAILADRPEEVRPICAADCKL